jgi:hypothetical protein
MLPRVAQRLMVVPGLILLPYSSARRGSRGASAGRSARPDVVAGLPHMRVAVIAGRMEAHYGVFTWQAPDLPVLLRNWNPL